jgi:serine/threonine protein kinase
MRLGVSADERVLEAARIAAVSARPHNNNNDAANNNNTNSNNNNNGNNNGNNNNNNGDPFHAMNSSNNPPQLSDFEIRTDDVVGKGSFGAVFASEHKASAMQCVMKVLDKQRGSSQRVYFRREVEALMRFDCKYIPQLLGAFEDPVNCYIALERRRGVDVFSFLEGKPQFKVPESEARFIAWQLVCATLHAHERGVVHRDIKLENILVDVATLDTTLIDFGLCFVQPFEGALCHDFCGSLDYASPEIVRKERAYLGTRADVWSLGVVIFILLFGITPFNRKHRSRAIRHGQPHPCVLFPRNPNVDSTAIDLIQRMLDVDADTRASMHDVYTHEWFAAMRDGAAQARPDLS